MSQKSLILQEEAEQECDPQLSLFCGAHIPKIRLDRTTPPFEYNGERLFRENRAVYETVVQLLADPGVSIRQIARVCHCSQNTVRAVAAREKIPIDAARQVIVSNMAYGLRLATEQVIEKLPQGNLKDSTIALGVLSQNLQLATGGVTQRIEIVPAVNVVARFKEYCDELSRKVEAREIGFRAENKLANGGEPTAANAGGLPIIEGDGFAEQNKSSKEAPCALPLGSTEQNNLSRESRVE